MTRRMSDDPAAAANRRGNLVLAAVAVLSVAVLVVVAILAPRGNDGTPAPAPDDTERRPLPPAAALDIAETLENPSLTPPRFAAAVPADGGGERLPLGTINELPGDEYLDFLFEFCEPACYRDAHFHNQQNPELGSGTWTEGRPFHVRHGFINNDPEPLTNDFDVVLYVTLDPEGTGFALEETVLVPGRTYRLASDYVMRGLTDRCGPGYKTQEGPETCEWFVHDFPVGLPEGRYDLWAVWQAPCWAWMELGFTDDCPDRDEILSLFSSGVNAPFDQTAPSFSARSDS